MKIAVISSVPGTPWAGSEELWYQTSLKLLQAGHQVITSIFQINGSCTQLDNFKANGGIINFRKPLGNGRIHVLKHQYISAFKKVFEWNPDGIVLSLGSMTDLALYPDLLRHLNKNTTAKVVMISLFNSDYIHMDAGLRGLLASYCRRTDHFVFVSHHNHLLAERQLAMKFKKVSVFSSPVSYLGTYEELPWPEDNSVIQMACVARLSVIPKGQDVLLESLSGEQWKNRSWKLNIYGRGEDEDYLKELISMYGLSDKVSFTGFVGDTRDIWKKNHLMVMASRAEGLSLAVLEAMICGRICVVTDVGGHGEVLQDSVSGFLAESAMPKYFEAALERAWAMQSQYNQIAGKAIVSAVKVFSEKPVDQMMEIILSGRG
jgi:glycosyltransferase involved in cell wall biosynthesis